MSSLPQGNRFAPPRAHVEDVEAGSAQLATRGARLGAAIIDVMVNMAFFVALAVLTPFNLFKIAQGNPSTTTLLTAFVAGFGWFLVVHGYLLAKRGQTVGKAALGLRIVRTNGEQASFGRLIGLRYSIGALLAAIPFLGRLYGLVDALLIFRASRRCLHDLIADTIVIKP